MSATAERYGGIRQVDDHVDAIDVEPAPRDRGADVSLVLMVGREDLHLALRLFGEVLGGKLRRHHRPRSLEVGIDARHVVHHADAQRTVHFGAGRRAQTDEQCGCDSCVLTHMILPQSGGRSCRPLCLLAFCRPPAWPQRHGYRARAKYVVIDNNVGQAACLAGTGDAAGREWAVTGRARWKGCAEWTRQAGEPAQILRLRADGAGQTAVTRRGGARSRRAQRPGRLFPAAAASRDLQGLHPDAGSR